MGYDTQVTVIGLYYFFAGSLKCHFCLYKSIHIEISEEQIITKMEEKVKKACDQDKASDHGMENVDENEDKFWKDLILACLQPGSSAFSLEASLKGNHNALGWLAS